VLNDNGLPAAHTRDTLGAQRQHMLEVTKTHARQIVQLSRFPCPMLMPACVVTSLTMFIIISISSMHDHVFLSAIMQNVMGEQDLLVFCDLACSCCGSLYRYGTSGMIRTFYLWQAWDMVCDSGVAPCHPF